MKGNVPFNKGKCWDGYMTKAAQRKSARGWANLDKFGRKEACAGLNRRPVVALTDGGLFLGRFESAVEAAHCIGTQQRNINKCCHKERKHAGKTDNGQRLCWFFEDDNEWTSRINNEYFIRNK
jgi:hypothetical protein